MKFIASSIAVAAAKPPWKNWPNSGVACGDSDGSAKRLQSYSLQTWKRLSPFLTTNCSPPRQMPWNEETVVIEKCKRASIVSEPKTTLRRESLLIWNAKNEPNRETKPFKHYTRPERETRHKTHVMMLQSQFIAIWRGSNSLPEPNQDIPTRLDQKNRRNVQVELNRSAVGHGWEAWSVAA